MQKPEEIGSNEEHGLDPEFTPFRAMLPWHRVSLS